jgi:hypothetical protein
LEDDVGSIALFSIVSELAYYCEMNTLTVSGRARKITTSNIATTVVNAPVWIVTIDSVKNFVYIACSEILLTSNDTVNDLIAFLDTCLLASLLFDS